MIIIKLVSENYFKIIFFNYLEQAKNVEVELKQRQYISALSIPLLNSLLMDNSKK